jgi:hypothetical protein
MASTGADALTKDVGPASPDQMERFCKGSISGQYTPFTAMRYHPDGDAQMPFEMIDCILGKIFLYDCDHLMALETFEDRYKAYLAAENRQMTDKQTQDLAALRARLRPFLPYCVAPPLS